MNLLEYSKDNLHDKRHKELFSNKNSFISLLKDCIKEPWVNDIDETSITKTNNSFILQDFTEKEADIVYEATLNGSKIVFYILLELQNKVDYLMPYRLLLYIVEILRNHYNHADISQRNSKNFKFPIVFPIVFFSGSSTWSVPLSLKEMFANHEIFGNYVLNFDYALVNAKGYDDTDLKNFSSKLLGLTLMLEKTKNDVEFFTNLKENLGLIENFNDEERRVLNMCIKIIDIAYGYNKSDDIQKMLKTNQLQEVDKMLSDVIEYAKVEREELKSQGVAQGITKGIAQGVTQGISQGANMLLELIKKGMSPEEAAQQIIRENELNSSLQEDEQE